MAKGRPRVEPIIRFRPKWKLSDTHEYNGEACWEWLAARLPAGYGVFWDGEKYNKAHRFAYEHFVGTIPEGKWVLHACDNPPCVNPAHLFVGTVLDNNRDKTEKGRHHESLKTHCPQGHPYDEINTYVSAKAEKRRCRTCNRENKRRQRRAA